MHVLAVLIWPMVCIIGRGQAPQQAPLEIVSFACARAYVAGTGQITLVSTVKNRTSASLAANAIRLRMHVLAGLDYVSGDTSPWAPGLEPGADATFKWQVQPSSQSGPLVASLSIESAGQAPTVKLIAIPRLAEQPAGETLTVSAIPTARARDSGGILENNKVRARIFVSESNIALLVLSVHTSGGWRQVAVSLPLADVYSGEGGQHPWWEVFKVDEIKASQSKDEAALALGGMFGVRWRATISLKLRANSSVIDYELQCAPTRQMKLSGVRICPLLAGDGSFGPAAAETLIGKSSGPNALSAIRWGEITFGRLERTELPWKEWEAKPMEAIEGAEYRPLGSEWRTTELPATYNAGAIIKLRARLFALTPSPTINDAFKIALPLETAKQRQ